MRDFIRRIFVGAVFLAPLFCALATTRVDAASVTGASLTTSPVAVDLIANPGTSTSTTLQIQNNEAAPVIIDVSLKEFTASGDNGQAQIIDPPAGDASPSWVHFSPSSFTAQPGVWNNVTMTINVPKTAAFGYYYTVLFTPRSAFSPKSNSASFKNVNAVFVLLNVPTKNETKKIAIKSFSVDSLVSQYLPVKFSLTVANVGNIYVVPRGYIYISRTPDGTPIDIIDVNGGLGNVLPGSTRTFHASWDDGFPAYQTKRVSGQIVSDKNGIPEQELTWNFDQVTKFRFGNYYARLVMVYSDGTRDIELSSVASFWVIPWIFLGIALLIVLLFGFSVWTLIRSLLRKLRRPARRR
ncbi:MAG TPA: hypothetical protein VNG90_03590 [Candidatus Acidoferrum sp.]|nr:hypothetical protein [Candidatus Acidoferrum sp.]